MTDPNDAAGAKQKKSASFKSEGLFSREAKDTK